MGLLLNVRVLTEYLQGPEFNPQKRQKCIFLSFILSGKIMIISYKLAVNFIFCQDEYERWPIDCFSKSIFTELGKLLEDGFFYKVDLKGCILLTLLFRHKDLLQPPMAIKNATNSLC